MFRSDCGAATHHIHIQAASINMECNVAVGIVPEGFEEVTGFPLGTRVAGVYSSPLRRFTSIKHAVKISKECDAGEVAALLSTYVPAQSILNLGKRKSKDRRLLVNAEENPNSLTIKSIFRLAKITGLTELFFESEKYGNHCLEHHGIKKDDGDLMDVIVDFAGDDSESICKKLSPRGRLILCSFDDPLWLKFVKWNSAFAHGGYIIDHASITLDQSNVLFLLSELKRRRLRPEITCYTTQTTKLENIALIHSGVVVCEPWKGEDSRVQNVWQ